MSDPLSDTFRANVEFLRSYLRLGYYAFGKIVTPHAPCQARTQLKRGFGFSLATVHHWSRRLGIDERTMLTPNGARRWIEEQHRLQRIA